MKISGAMLNDSISISLTRVSSAKFSIKFAVSEGCRSFKDWLIN